MSFICGLCGEWNKYGGNTVTIHPDPGYPNNLSEEGELCNNCLSALKDAHGKDCLSEFSDCAWCGGDGLYEVWTLGGMMGGTPEYPRFKLCSECWSQVIDEYPAEFSGQLKQRVRERDGKVCTECGMPQKEHRNEFNQSLHVHHIDGDKTNNKLENLVSLCTRCHGSK